MTDDTDIRIAAAQAASEAMRAITQAMYAMGDAAKQATPAMDKLADELRRDHTPHP